MPDTEKFEAAKKSVRKQDDKKTLKEKLNGKKQMIVLWTTVLGLFGTTGIPKIIEMLESKPSVGQVQTMIAQQTEELSAAQRVSVDAMKHFGTELERARDALDRFREEFPVVQSRVELLHEVLRDCCTRRRARDRLARGSHARHGHEGVPPKPELKPDPDPELESDAVSLVPLPEPKNKNPVKMLTKVPEFKQEQLQLQESE